MTPEEYIAALDERIRKLEGLVKLQLCVCRLGPTSYSTTRRGCPFHGGARFVPLQEIIRDRAEWMWLAS